MTVDNSQDLQIVCLAMKFCFCKSEYRTIVNIT